MTILVTGAAGFIGFNLSKSLVNIGYSVVGLDNLNSYYDRNLKIDRLKELGLDVWECESGNETNSKSHPGLSFIKCDLCETEILTRIFNTHRFSIAVNLAAQAGVRYSMENPLAYIKANVEGFVNLLECCRSSKIHSLLYASSSSVYGGNESLPFSIRDRTDTPLSLYAATKKTNELIAYAYTRLYTIRTVGLRFFTVYGPWGRPDMALFKFTESILNGKTIDIYNNGNMSRDFTYIDDIVGAVVSIVKSEMTIASGEEKVLGGLSNPWRVYNIGNHNPTKLMDFVHEIERVVGLPAKMRMLPLQPGDVPATFADISETTNDYGYKPRTDVATGVREFVNWYLSYYKIEEKSNANK